MIIIVNIDGIYYLYKFYIKRRGLTRSLCVSIYLNITGQWPWKVPWGTPHLLLQHAIPPTHKSFPFVSLFFTLALFSHPHSSFLGTEHHVSLGRTLHAVPACLKNQRSPPRPCSQRAHFSHFLPALCEQFNFSPPHIIQALRQRRTGWDRYVLSLTLHPHPPCLFSSVSKVSQ